MRNKGFYERNLTLEELALRRNRENCDHNYLYSQSEFDNCKFLKRNGLSTSGKQKYFCKLCGATITLGANETRMTWKEIKRIFYLEQIEGLSIRQIAKELGYSPSTICENKKIWQSI